MSPFALNPPGGGEASEVKDLHATDLMFRFVAGLPSPGLPLPPSQQPGQVLGQRAMLAKEEWFHGPISR